MLAEQARTAMRHAVPNRRSRFLVPDVPYNPKNTPFRKIANRRMFRLCYLLLSACAAHPVKSGSGPMVFFCFHENPDEKRTSQPKDCEVLQHLAVSHVFQKFSECHRKCGHRHPPLRPSFPPQGQWAQESLRREGELPAQTQRLRRPWAAQ